MSRRTLAVLAVVGALVVSGTAFAFFTGMGPAPGGDPGGDQVTDYATGTPLGTAAAGDAGDTSGTTAPFSFTIESIEECGQTCRDVTVSLHNNQDEAASDVTVLTRIYAGRDTTAEEDRVWEGREEVGDLAGGGTHTTTTRVELSLQEALKIQNNDGYITIVTTVRTADQTVTFKDVEQVT